jgi:hypothetical protein
LDVLAFQLFFIFLCSKPILGKMFDIYSIFFFISHFICIFQFGFSNPRLKFTIRLGKMNTGEINYWSNRWNWFVCYLKELEQINEHMENKEAVKIGI